MIQARQGSAPVGEELLEGVQLRGCRGDAQHQRGRVADVEADGGAAEPFGGGQLLDGAAGRGIGLDGERAVLPLDFPDGALQVVEAGRTLACSSWIWRRMSRRC